MVGPRVLKERVAEWLAYTRWLEERIAYLAEHPDEDLPYDPSDHSNVASCSVLLKHKLTLHRDAQAMLARYGPIIR